MAMIDIGDGADDFRIVRLSALKRGERHRLIDRYRRHVYERAFPDAEIREDPAYWQGLLDAEPYPPSPQPRIDVILILRPDGAVVGGVTIELYRQARAGLLTYIAVDECARGQGIGRQLVAAARQALDQMAGGAVPMFAETERFCDAATADERAATVTRQRQLAGLGARRIAFDYWMPPLRPGLAPHQLHLLLFGDDASVPAERIAALLDELARALGSDLNKLPQTRSMVVHLERCAAISTAALPTEDAA